MRPLATVLVPAALVLSMTPALGARQSFDPSAACSRLLLTGNAGDKTLSVFWASGYLAKTDGKERVITQQHIEGMYSALQAVCKQAPDVAFQKIVDRFAVAQLPPKPARPPAPPKPAVISNNQSPPAATVPASPTQPPVTSTPSVAQTASVVQTPAKTPRPPELAKLPAPEQPIIAGRSVLLKFFDATENKAVLTASLKPSAADIHAIYEEPLASKLVVMYNKMFKPGVVIKPKPEQTGLYSVETTTQKLRNRNSVLRQFPVGYKKVIPYIHGNNNIIRFKFVKQGEKTGLAFDGFIFVNGRWVLMPKPWRALEQ